MRTRRNQTKVGLKCFRWLLRLRMRWPSMLTKVGLKCFRWRTSRGLALLKKSDQGGIEINEIKTAISDDNLKKSDQGGIEIDALDIDAATLDGRNQTKVGLKSVTTLLERLTQREEIRPRWDWNCGWQRVLERGRERRNQTKVGLKSTKVATKAATSGAKKSDQGGIEMFAWHLGHPSGNREEIRPRWDWNSDAWMLTYDGGLEEIRPRWDWNKQHRRD